jgi:GDP-4-dehydro-6-deoxy-D-mannose reductase
VAGEVLPDEMEVGNLEARRDFSDVRDIVSAYRLMEQRDGGIWNLGSGQSRSIRQMLDALIAISGCAVEVRQDPARMRGPEMADLYGCIAAASASLGRKPEISIGVSPEDAYRHWYESLA